MASLAVLLGESPAVVAVREQIERLLRTSAGPARRLPPILVLGETGTGKGLLASSVHRAGPRAASPFVDVNCSAIPETLLEAELFGYERGAFTDARQAKPGLFQAAHGGTMFLDEVGLLPTVMQAKLLKVIEERSVRRLGSTRAEPIDVSVIAATSEDLPAAVRAGRFRADLYHRLAVVTVTLPPLRERGRDIVLLAQHFLAKVCEEYGLPSKTLTEDAHAALLAYPWPGNVRELANVLERTALLTDEARITAAALALPDGVELSADGPERAREAGVESPARGAPSGEETAAGSDEDAERRELRAVLEQAGWNITRAAARLGVPRNTLRYRVERLRLSLPPERRRGGRPRSGRGAPAPSPPVPEAPLARERRRVTLLEARLTNAGPDSDARHMRRARDTIVEKLQTFGGYTDRLGVDGVLAIFGLEPDEDAPRRAAHAAMALQKLAARARHADPALPRLAVALHTAVLGVARAGDDMEFDPDDYREARRVLHEVMSSAGAGGKAVASEAAMRFLARRFELAALHIDGAADAWEVLRSAEPGRTRFVGREQELRVLSQRLELAHAGRGQVVLLVGEPGVGKSRLLHEFRRQLGSTATWVEGHALSFGRSISFHPVIDMLKRVFRIDDGDAEADVVTKVEHGMRRLGDDLAPMLPFIRYLLSVDPGDPAVLTMDPKVRHGRIVRSTHLLLERGAEQRTHVLVLEDAHWADPATEDWITRLAESIGARRALIIVSARPGYRAPFSHLGFYTALALSTLSSDDTLRIAGDLLGVRVPAPLEALIVDKADGNPFFVEELVRSLHELGIVQHDGDRVTVMAEHRHVEVPDTVQEVILARIERLDEAMKQLLRVASVIGRAVPVPLLRALTRRGEDSLDADLRALQAAEFVYVTRTFPELEYTFKHALTQDVAYASLKEDERRMLHAGVVEAIETLYAGRVGEHVERLAHHAFRGELWRRAASYARQAGMKAFDRSANREAVASLEQALVALTHLPEDRERLEEAIDIRLILRSALLQLGEIRRMTDCVREAEALALAARDQGRLAWVWTYMTICHLFGGAPNEAVALGERAFALAEDVGDVALRATARTPWAHAYREVGQYARAIDLLRGTIAALSGDLVRQRLGQGMPPGLYARNVAALCLAELGEFGEAVAMGSESVEIAEALDVPFGAVLARIALGQTYLVQGRIGEAATVLDAALELIDSRDIPAWFPWAAAARGYAYAMAGQPQEAVALLQRALDRAASLRFLFGHSQWTAWLAHAEALAGSVGAAGALVDEALRLSRERGERGYQAWTLYVQGEVRSLAPAAGADTAGEAQRAHREALRLATELGMRPLIARCERALARLAEACDDAAAAGEHARRARTLFAALDMPDDVR